MRKGNEGLKAKGMTLPSSTTQDIQENTKIEEFKLKPDRRISWSLSRPALGARHTLVPCAGNLAEENSVTDGTSARQH
jgi:hypothetical protein